MEEPTRAMIGPFRIDWSPWLAAKDGLSLMHRGRKVRISFMPDGRIRFRAVEAGPMALLECYLTGTGQDVVVTLGPRLKEEAKDAGHRPGRGEEADRGQGEAPPQP